MGKKLTKKLLVFLTLMCMIIGMNVSISAETGSTGNTKAISAAEIRRTERFRYGLSMKMITETV